jgi:hypothetical protein
MKQRSFKDSRLRIIKVFMTEEKSHRSVNYALFDHSDHNVTVGRRRSQHVAFEHNSH